MAKNTNMTNWLKIDKDNLPKEEVVAVNMDYVAPGLRVKKIGRVSIVADTILVYGKYDSVGSRVTHYLPLPKDEEIEG